MCLRAEQETMRNEKVESIQAKNRNKVVPRPSKKDAVGSSRNESGLNSDGPAPSENTHVAVLVVFVCLGISGRSPRKSASEKTVLNSGEVGVLLNSHDVLHVDGVLCLSPKTNGDKGVKKRRNGEGKVVVLQEVGADPHEEHSGKRVDEDGKSGGRVVHHSGQVTDLLNDTEV